LNTLFKQIEQMKELQNYHILEVKYYGPTSHKGSRIRIYSERFNQTIFIPFDNEYSNISEMAQKYLAEKGFKLIGKGETEDGSILISTTFEPLK